MTHKEFVSELADRVGLTQAKTAELLDVLLETLCTQLAEGNSIAFQGFGLLEPKKKMERIIVNPATKQRFLVPPKISVSYRPSQNLKHTINSKNDE